MKLRSRNPRDKHSSCLTEPPKIGRGRGGDTQPLMGDNGVLCLGCPKEGKERPGAHAMGHSPSWVSLTVPGGALYRVI